MAEEKQEQTQDKPKRGKKINKMSTSEVEKALENAKNTQGGTSSRYAQALLRRAENLRSGK
jgi:putative cell wall-binding protein